MSIAHARRGTDVLHLVRRTERASRLLRELPTEHELTAAGPGEFAPGPGGVPLAAARVRLGKIPSKVVRLRAVYPTAGYAVAIHANLIPFRRRTHLVRGAQTLERLRPDGGIRVPRPLERHRGLREAWVVEEYIDGVPLDGAEWRVAAPEAARGLADLWLRNGLGVVARGDRSEDVEGVRRLLARQELRARAEGVLDAAGVAARAAAIVSGSDAALTAGWCHGDPVGGNWLRTPDGGLALIDWEFFAWRPLGHDAVRVILGLDEALGIADEMEVALRSAGRESSTPWRHELAIALVRWLAHWPRGLGRSSKPEVVERFWRRAVQRLVLLDQLTQ